MTPYAKADVGKDMFDAPENRKAEKDSCDRKPPSNWFKQRQRLIGLKDEKNKGLAALALARPSAHTVRSGYNLPQSLGLTSLAARLERLLLPMT